MKERPFGSGPAQIYEAFDRNGRAVKVTIPPREEPEAGAEELLRQVKALRTALLSVAHARTLGPDVRLCFCRPSRRASEPCSPTCEKARAALEVSR